MPGVKKSGVKGEGDDPGGRNMDERRTGWSCRNSLGGGYKRMNEIEGDDPVDGMWTSDGRAGAEEIAWEEARDRGATSKGMN